MELLFKSLEWTSQGGTALSHRLQFHMLVAAHVLCDPQVQKGLVTDMLLLQTITITCRTTKVRTNKRLGLQQPTAQGCDAAW